MIRRSLLAVAVLAALGGIGAEAAPASARADSANVTIGGAVAAPLTYSMSSLAALPQTTFSARRRVSGELRTYTDEGVPLEGLVDNAQPVLPDAKNALLRVTVTVGNKRGRRVTFALGELDPGFGDHPAYLALQQNGRALVAPRLIVPGDASAARTVSGVSRITVGVHNPTPTTPPEAGSLMLQDRGVTQVLSASQLASLPARTLEVTFEAGTSSQQHTEIGPTLDTVLRAARIHVDFNTWVAAVGSDGYVAIVTPAEAWVGERPLLISLNEDGQTLTQPRLVVDGDIKGGRYVSGVDDLVIGSF
ncbi:MAG: hypothetical protein JO372_23515 [Solirubrobacterales bacterium]|nr:hypothetical protein [Solirubrobacterales bacterium]